MFGIFHTPVLDDEGKEVRHRRGPQFAQGIVIEALVETDDILQVFLRDGQGLSQERSVVAEGIWNGTIDLTIGPFASSPSLNLCVKKLCDPSRFLRVRIFTNMSIVSIYESVRNFTTRTIAIVNAAQKHQQVRTDKGA